MARRVKELPLAPLEKILRAAGAKRVSKDAVLAFTDRVIEYAHQLAAKAASLAEHAGRKTVIDADIRTAKRSLSA